MTYSESLTPPEKTNFEYKNDIVKKYGRIFSPENIGNYSSKIKSICNNILNSDGVIIIYSQYLDGGLVPLALALEEMGIRRHGNVKSLFKKSPTTNPLDLKTYTTESKNDIIPAKYVMITGDKMLSPDNVEDLKHATSIDNVNGENVKVILISQAGSEGLDFKFIRQIHILEPWYNMNRIEQILGRGVRQCSHKNLPLEKRNVQIFLYGSLLENVQEESADLYVYRLAEIKAKQIGKITRIMKEVSVDCILNIEQTNFSSENLKQEIPQILSNRREIEFQVGDKPYSAICDYMEDCIYKCKPNNIIGKVNSLSYNENFINFNNEKIIQRIKEIFKDVYFIRKDNLIKEINIIKNYPLIQIYGALTQLINDKTNYIVDRYDRLGHLINIDDLYLFQPIEINNNNISLDERNNPIPFKHTKLSVMLSDKIDDSVENANKEKKQIKLKLVPDNGENKTSVIDDKRNIAKIILKKMETNYNLVTNEQIIKRGEENWYILASSIITYINDKDGLNREMLYDFIIEHIIDELLFSDTINILNYLYNDDSVLTTFENKIKSFYDVMIIKNKNITGIMLQNEGKQQLVINKVNTWILAEPEDYTDLSSQILEMITSMNKINDIVGFMSNFRKGEIVFKVKQLTKKRNKGARCDQSGKSDTIKMLNLIVNEEKYTSVNTKQINSTQICILEELLLRYYDYIEKSNMRWFLNINEATLINVEKMEK